MVSHRARGSHRSGAPAETAPSRTRVAPVDYDVFDGLPVRRWARQIFTISQSPQAIGDSGDRGYGWTPNARLPMPKDSHLLTPISRALLSAARAGCKYIKAPDRSEFKNGADGEEEDTDGEGFSFTRTFPVGKWASLPRHMELPEPEYLAKARPNFVPLTGFIGADKDGFVATKDRVEGMRKVHVKQVDAGTGKAWLYKTIVPEGYVVEGELANGDPQTEQQESAEDVAIATPAPGTVIGGIGVVNSKGVLVANIDEPLVTPQSRPRVPTKRRMRGGPGRGKKKRVMFAHETHGHEQVDMPVTSASTPLSVAPTAFASPAAVLPEASLASPSQRVSRHAHDAEEATNSDARGSHPADEEESDAVMAGAPLTSMTDLSLSSQHGQQLSDTKPSSEPTAKGYGEASSEQDFDSSSGHMLDAQPRSTVDAQRPEPARDEGSQAITATDQEGTATLNRSAVDLITDQTSELNNSANNISLSPSTSAADERTKVSQASAAQLHVRIQETSASVIDSSHMLSKHEDRASHATTPAAMPIERCPSQSMAVACEGGPGCASHSDSADTIAEQQKSITEHKPTSAVSPTSGTSQLSLELDYQPTPDHSTSPPVAADSDRMIADSSQTDQKREDTAVAKHVELMTLDPEAGMEVSSEGQLTRPLHPAASAETPIAPLPGQAGKASISGRYNSVLDMAGSVTVKPDLDLALKTMSDLADSIPSQETSVAAGTPQSFSRDVASEFQPDGPSDVVDASHPFRKSIDQKPEGNGSTPSASPATVPTAPSDIAADPQSAQASTSRSEERLDATAVDDEHSRL